jgi:hypothetical protein
MIFHIFGPGGEQITHMAATNGVVEMKSVAFAYALIKVEGKYYRVDGVKVDNGDGTYNIAWRLNPEPVVPSTEPRFEGIKLEYLLPEVEGELFKVDVVKVDNGDGTFGLQWRLNPTPVT